MDPYSLHFRGFLLRRRSHSQARKTFPSETFSLNVNFLSLREMPLGLKPSLTKRRKTFEDPK